MERRARAVRPLTRFFTDLFRSVTGQGTEVCLLYEPSWNAEASAPEAVAVLRASRERDCRRALTTTGPHRDRFVFEYGGREFAHVASTGQVRLCSLVLRSAQAAYYNQITGRAPILLLDDVILELDPERKASFMAALPPCDQALFTFLPGEGFEQFRTDTTLVLEVQEGRMRSWGTTP